MISRSVSEAARKLGWGRATKPRDWHERPYSQKIVWRCKHPDPMVDYARWTDKFLAKEFVAAHFDVAETYAATCDPNTIDFERLPETFVMKATHGWNMSLLVEDGVVQGGNRTLGSKTRKCSTALLRETAAGWFSSKTEKKRRKRQKHYRQLKPGILIEEFLTPIDYELQLFLFEGRCRFAMVIFREFHHSTVAHQLYNEEWELLEPGSQEFGELYWNGEAVIAPPPSDLLETLQSLCAPIDHVRADFFVCGGRYYFSEFTFTHNGGRGAGFVGKHDAELGRFWRR